jgi:hypothetical protein
VYVSETGIYCFAYPGDFTLDNSSTAESISLYGTALGDSLEPVRVSLGITAQAVPEGSDLTRLVDAYLSQSFLKNPPWPIERTSLMLGGEPAVRLEDIPGQFSSRVILSLRGATLLTLQFHPSDGDIAEPSLEALFQTVTGSFAFFNEPAQSQSDQRTVTWYEFGRSMAVTFDSRLAPWVEAMTVPAVALSDQIMFAESHPPYAEFRFLGFQGGRVYDLPLLPADNRMAQVMIFQTADFSGFGSDQPAGFPGQAKALADSLSKGVDPNACNQPFLGDDRGLPFLPWVNLRQVFCAQPEVLAFSQGSGLRYLSYYAQGPVSALERQIFYTFQGLTDDGQFYISAIFPVATGIFPTEPPAAPDPNYLSTLTAQVTQLNAQPADRFNPSLTVLDKLVGSIRIMKP